MSKRHHLETIARHIRINLENGFVLDLDSIHFLASTFSISGPEDLTLLRDERHANERETLFDLVISPDRSFLCVMEPFLMGHEFTLNDEKELVRMIRGQNIKTRIAYPDHHEYLECDLHHDLIERFVRKLRITFSFPDQLVAEMNSSLSGTIKHDIGMMFRHSGISWQDDVLDFFSLFFRYGPSNPDLMYSDLEYALGILKGSDSNKSIRDRLIDCLSDHQKRLGEIKTIDEMLKKNTMEILMLQGVRVPSISEDTILSRITKARRILASVYGWTEQSDPAPSSRDLGDYVGEDGINKMVALLS